MFLFAKRVMGGPIGTERARMAVGTGDFEHSLANHSSNDELVGDGF